MCKDVDGLRLKLHNCTPGLVKTSAESTPYKGATSPIPLEPLLLLYIPPTSVWTPIRCWSVGTVRVHLSGQPARRTRVLSGFCNAVNYFLVSFFLIAYIFTGILFLEACYSFLSSLQLRDYTCHPFKRIHIKIYTYMYTSIAVFYYFVLYYIKYCRLYNYWTLR